MNQVSGTTVADWKHEAGSLTVSFLEPIVTTTSLVLSAEVRAPREGTIAIPIVRMPAAERETGGIAVDVIGAGEITDRQPRGVDPADPAISATSSKGVDRRRWSAFGFKPLAGNAVRGLTVNVSRYTPQAVLVANVEEARYEALVTEDGKLLVRARFAVRNNQRAFLALKLPAQSVLWSAALAGRPVRPGVSADGGYLLPLVKGRAGEAAPTFAVELVYLQRTPAWSEKGEARVDAARRRSPGLPDWIGRQLLTTFSCRTAARSVSRRAGPAALERGASRQRVGCRADWIRNTGTASGGWRS